MGRSLLRFSITVIALTLAIGADAATDYGVVNESAQLHSLFDTWDVARNTPCYDECVRLQADCIHSCRGDNQERCFYECGKDKKSCDHDCEDRDNRQHDRDHRDPSG